MGHPAQYESARYFPYALAVRSPVAARYARGARCSRVANPHAAMPHVTSTGTAYAEKRVCLPLTLPVASQAVPPSCCALYRRCRSPRPSPPVVQSPPHRRYHWYSLCQQNSFASPRRLNLTTAGGAATVQKVHGDGGLDRTKRYVRQCLLAAHLPSKG